MLFEQETFSKIRIEELEIANMITKNWYAIANITVAKHLSIKVMEYHINEFGYDIYAIKRNDEIYFEGRCKYEWMKENWGNWTEKQLHNYFIFDEEWDTDIIFYVEELKKIYNAIKNLNPSYEELKDELFNAIPHTRLDGYTFI